MEFVHISRNVYWDIHVSKGIFTQYDSHCEIKTMLKLNTTIDIHATNSEMISLSLTTYVIIAMEQLNYLLHHSESQSLLHNVNWP